MTTICSGCQRRLRYERCESRRMLSTTPGDYSVNGIVDASDYIVWRKTLGTTVAVAEEGADGNGDGTIGPADFVVWRTNFGNSAALPENWFDTHIQDVALRTIGHNLYVDGVLDRDDMLALFTSAQDEGMVDGTEFLDLARIVSDPSLFGPLDSVAKLAGYVVAGDAANALYQGQALGNLEAGSTATHLQNLVNKWFLGLDRPATPSSYALASGTLFVDGPSYSDIKQGAFGDCAFLASLAETALRSPNTITEMFVVNGDGTYAVRFFHGDVAEYVTVDSYLPSGGGTYARVVNDELWVALAEKAYAQIGETSWFIRENSYASIEYLYAASTLAEITGQTTRGFNSTSGTSDLAALATAWNAGELICLVSSVTPPTAGIVSNHVYAVVGYDATAQTVTLFSPWGIAYGLTTLTWSQVQANMPYFDRTA